MTGFKDFFLDELKDVKAAIKRFDDEFGMGEAALEKLFEDKDDFDKSVIFARVMLLDRFYGTGLRDHRSDGSDGKPAVWITLMAEHIVKTQEDIKKMLADPDPYAAVKSIMKVSYDTEGEKRYKNVYSFATKYCNWMDHEKYPIYDSLAGDAVYRYFKSMRPDAKMTKTSMWIEAEDIEELDRAEGYINYCNRIKELMAEPVIVENFGDSLSLKNMDKFLWLCGKKWYTKKA